MLNRFSYGLNNPSRYTDPSGHVPVDCYGTDYCGASNSDLLPDFKPSKPINTAPAIPPPTPGNSNQGTATPPLPQNPLSTPSPGSTITPIPTVCPTPMPNQTSCEGYPALTNVYYTYEGSIIPVIGLAVDVGGMVIDGASILASFGLGPPEILVSAEAQFAMSSAEFGWSVFMQSTGQYEAVYDHTASLLDANGAKYTDSQEVVPIAGFTASFVSATNNIQVILSGFEAHYLP